MRVPLPHANIINSYNTRVVEEASQSPGLHSVTKNNQQMITESRGWREKVQSGDRPTHSFERAGIDLGIRNNLLKLGILNKRVEDKMREEEAIDKRIRRKKEQEQQQDERLSHGAEILDAVEHILLTYRERTKHGTEPRIHRGELCIGILCAAGSLMLEGTVTGREAIRKLFSSQTIQNPESTATEVAVVEDAGTNARRISMAGLSGLGMGVLAVRVVHLITTLKKVLSEVVQRRSEITEEQKARRNEQAEH